MSDNTKTYEHAALGLPQFSTNQPGQTSEPSAVARRDVTSVFADFTEPMLQNAGIFKLCDHAMSNHDFWTPLATPEIVDLRRWVHRELLAFGFLLELAYSDFSFAKYVTKDFTEILDAFKSVLVGQGYLSTANGKPAVVGWEREPRIILAAATRAIDVFGGDPIDCLHSTVCATACMTRPHSQAEIDALRGWVDEAFVTCAIEKIRAVSYMSGQAQPLSKAERNAGALVSVVLGHSSVEWSTSGPVFKYLPIPSRRIAKRSSKQSHCHSS